MSTKALFPNWQKVVRNAICVGFIALASSGIADFPPTARTGWAAITGFAIAFIIEFANAYYKKPVKKSSAKVNATFFF